MPIERRMHENSDKLFDLADFLSLDAFLYAYVKVAISKFAAELKLQRYYVFNV